MCPSCDRRGRRNTEAQSAEPSATGSTQRRCQRFASAHTDGRSSQTSNARSRRATAALNRTNRAAAAMVDRLIQYAELISLKGDSYRLKDRDVGLRPTRPRDTT